MSKLLSKIQNLPEKKRKIIFWAIIIIISFILLNFYLKSVGKTLERGVKFPEVESPKIEIPEALK